MNLLRPFATRVAGVARQDFVRAVGVLAGGTAIAQLALVLAVPVLTRIYTPSDFGLLGVYTAALSILAVVACLRLEIAIPLPRDDGDAKLLLIAALASAAFVSLVLVGLVAAIPSTIARWLGQPGIAPYLWLLPLGVWLASSYSALQYWASRKKRFGRISKTRMSQALSGVGAQIGFGLAGVAPFGLLLGHALSGGVGVVTLGRQALDDPGSSARPSVKGELRRVLVEYRRFPTYSALEALLINAGSQLPLILLAGMVGGAEVGYLMLASRVMAMPMSLVGSAVGQVYLAHAAEHARDGTLGKFTVSTVNKLMAVGVGPLLLVGILAPALAGVVLGGPWERAGQLIFLMTPMVLLQFTSSPISMAMHVLGRQREMLLLVALGFIARIGAIVLADRFHMDAVEAYIAGATFFYFTLNAVVWRYAGCRGGLSRLATVIPLAWLGAALCLRWAAHLVT